MATADAMAVAVHTLSYLTAMALAAWVVYRKLGLSLLRRAWFNMDWLWAGALMITSAIVLLSSGASSTLVQENGLTATPISPCSRS